MDNEIRVGTGVRSAKGEEHCDYATGFIWDEKDGLYSVCWMWAGVIPGKEYPINRSGAPGANIWSKEELQVMSQPDHDFVPFNVHAQLAYKNRRGNGFIEAWECFEMFAQCIDCNEQFLSFEELTPRSQKPGYRAKAKFVLSTGGIQEVHVRNGESAIEAFRRWKKEARYTYRAHEDSCKTSLCRTACKCSGCRQHPHPGVGCPTYERLRFLAGDL